MKCPLCGHETPADAANCRGCALRRSCQTIRCEHCGYRTVEDSALVNLVRRLWGRPRPTEPQAGCDGGDS